MKTNYTKLCVNQYLTDCKSTNTTADAAHFIELIQEGAFAWAAEAAKEMATDQGYITQMVDALSAIDAD
jgi:hypothetical protein